jgi:hypothetical protein
MVIVVGGFGRNPYLFKKISEYCEKRRILARKPTFPWSAVVRGAVCRGLEAPSTGLIAVRLARRYYGTPVSIVFEEGVHDQEDAYIDDFTKKKYAKGQMRWMIDKGERLPEDTPKRVSIECCCTFKRTEDREFGAVLVGCDSDQPPPRYAHNSKWTNFRDYRRESLIILAGAYNICRVRADMSTVPESKFARARSGLDGEEFLVAEIKLQATFVAGMINWVFIFDGKEYGSVSVSYDQNQ